MIRDHLRLEHGDRSPVCAMVGSGGSVDQVYDLVDCVYPHAPPDGDSPATAAIVGRTEEAVAVLLPHVPANSYDLAGYLIDLGRIEEAVAVLHQDQPSPPQSLTTAWIEEPPF